MSLPAVTLIFDLLTPKSNQHIYEPIYICDQNWVKLPSVVLRYRVHKVFRMHRLTQSLTDGQTLIHNASGIISQLWRRH